MTQSARLVLSLYGPFAARLPDGGALSVPLRGAAILAALALAPSRRMPRGEVAALIWPDRADEQARASLRQELSALRRVLPDAVLGGDRGDVWLEEGAVHCAPAADAGAELLEGFALTSPTFADWLRGMRSSTRARDLEHAIREAEDALAAGEGLAARAAAQKALTLDPCAEPAARALMRAEAALGNRAAALSAYRDFCATLKRELDVAPDGETAALAGTLRGETPPRAAAEPRKGRRPVLAVLPFDELGAPEGDMFADALVEEITGALSRTDAFDVIARQSAFALGTDARDTRRAATALGADYIVEGSLRRSGDRVRVTAGLVGGDSGVTLWSERFDDRLDDLFDLLDRISAQVTGHLAPHLRRAEIARAHRRPKAERTAYEQVLSALPHFWAHRKDENARALAHLDAALDMSPNDPLALGYKAWAMGQQCSYLWSDNPERDRAISTGLAERALPQAGDRPDVLVALAGALSLAASDFHRSRALAARALAIDPNNAWAWMREGWALTYLGDSGDALKAFDRAEVLSPLDPFRFNILLGRAGALRALGRLDESVALIEEALRSGPGVTWAYRMLAGTLSVAGRHDEAREAARKWRDAHPNLTRDMLLRSLPKWTHDDGYVRALHRLVDEAF